MKFNIADPATGGQKKIEIDDEKFIRPLYERKMGQEFDGKILGEAFAGYVFRLTGGNDKQGFQMKQGIMSNTRVRILFRKRGTNYKPTRTGERKRKSVRGSIYGPDLAAIQLRVIKKGEKEIDGVTNVARANRLGAKRRNNIIKTFALDKKKDDVRQYVVRREIKRKDKTFYKSPKIQRLITETRLRRKKLHKTEVKDRNKNTREAHEKYEKLLSQYAKEQKAKKQAANAAAVVAATPAAPVKAVAAPAKVAAAPAKTAAPAKVVATPAPAKAAAKPDVKAKPAPKK